MGGEFSMLLCYSRLQSDSALLLFLLAGLSLGLSLGPLLGRLLGRLLRRLRGPAVLLEPDSGASLLQDTPDGIAVKAPAGQKSGLARVGFGVCRRVAEFSLPQQQRPLRFCTAQSAQALGNQIRPQPFGLQLLLESPVATADRLAAQQ